MLAPSLACVLAMGCRGRGGVAQKFSLTPVESGDPTLDLVLHSPGAIPDPGASTFFRILQMVRVPFGGLWVLFCQPLELLRSYPETNREADRNSSK